MKPSLLSHAAIWNAAGSSRTITTTELQVFALPLTGILAKKYSPGNIYYKQLGLPGYNYKFF